MIDLSLFEAAIKSNTAVNFFNFNFKLMNNYNYLKKKDDLDRNTYKSNFKAY